MKLTPAQRRELKLAHEKEFIIMPNRTPRGLTRYKPLWALVEMGLLQFGSGPRNSWLTTYGFSPLWEDPIV